MSKPRFECDVCGADRETVRCNGRDCLLMVCLDCLKQHEQHCVERNGDRTQIGSARPGSDAMKRKLSTRNAIKKPETKDFIQAIAMNIGKQVAHHIEIMYPEAVEACASTFLLSVRNCTYNNIMSALNPENANKVSDSISRDDKFRRETSAAYRKIRKVSAS